MARLPRFRAAPPPFRLPIAIPLILWVAGAEAVPALPIETAERAQTRSAVDAERDRARAPASQTATAGPARIRQVAGGEAPALQIVIADPPPTRPAEAGGPGVKPLQARMFSSRANGCGSESSS